MSLEGQQLGRYHLQHLLGSGGMGEVYLAMDTYINRQVAIKVIRAEASSYPDATARKEAARLFQREMRTIAVLDHPRILPLYDYGEEQTGRITLTYMVMPYRKEGSLADWLYQRKSSELLTPGDVGYLVHQAASALQHAHNRQIIHQDIKPSNFLIRSSEEQPKRPDMLLADFGVAKFISASVSMSQAIHGTPAYMSPEQWEGVPVPATDQYALAVMAYELLTGRTPFQGGLGQMMYQHFHVPPQPPSTLNPRFPKALDTVLLQALAKKPAERFASITVFDQAFQQAVLNMGLQVAAEPTPAQSQDLHATLAISKREALTGTSRTLTLPGGQHITVTIPAGAKDGQVVRLEDRGGLSGSSSAGALILTLAIQSADEIELLSDQQQDEVKTFLSDRFAVQSMPGTSPGQLPAQPGASGPSNRPRQPAVPASRSKQPAEQPEPGSPPVVKEPESAKRGRVISRRSVLVGMAALATASGGVTWLVVSLRSQEGTLLYTYQGHTSYVNAVAWSPDGSRIASASSDGTVQVWNATDGSNAYTYHGHTGFVNAVAWSPNSSHIASAGSDGTVQVWNAADGSNAYIYHGHTSYVYTVAWSPNGSRIASASSDDTVQVWQGP